MLLTEADILEKVVSPGDKDMNPEAARAILGFKFDRLTTRQIRQLLQKNNCGTISVEERLTLERFLRVGKLVDILHAQAKRSLRNAGAAT